ncbi:hypothetical protein GQ53DRAFT_55249 [Thozetella sp. PMI_491]|nr:hypothetical protein GQ53DRAFT_55249 [Thozetella sp. PMI_491]
MTALARRETPTSLPDHDLHLAQTILRLEISQATAYNSLPHCAKSTVSSWILSNAACLAAGEQNQSSYVLCVCSKSDAFASLLSETSCPEMSRFSEVLRGYCIHVGIGNTMTSDTSSPLGMSKSPARGSHRVRDIGGSSDSQTNAIIIAVSVVAGVLILVVVATAVLYIRNRWGWPFPKAQGTQPETSGTAPIELERFA